MKFEIRLFIPLVILLGILLTTNALAHGVSIGYTIKPSVEVTAAYDSGEPLAEAQVVVYAPNHADTPWLKGITDDEGRFVFLPDPNISGIYDVQVRQAGHGEIIHIPLDQGGVSSVSTAFTTGQIILMSASVIWGLIGTALYFYRRNA